MLARVTWFAEKATRQLADRDSLLDLDGELRPSVEVVRRLSDTQMKMLAAVGLTPASKRLLNREHPSDIDAAFERIEKAYRERHGGEVVDVEIEPADD